MTSLLRRSLTLSGRACVLSLSLDDVTFALLVCDCMILFASIDMIG